MLHLPCQVSGEAKLGQLNPPGRGSLGATEDELEDTVTLEDELDVDATATLDDELGTLDAFENELDEDVTATLEDELGTLDAFEDELYVPGLLR